MSLSLFISYPLSTSYLLSAVHQLSAFRCSPLSAVHQLSLHQLSALRCSPAIGSLLLTAVHQLSALRYLSPVVTRRRQQSLAFDLPA
jgi:hypothetical protein